MRIDRIQVFSFRNLKPLTLELNPTLNLFCGPNGQGKTNFLEAVYAALRGASFRPYAQRKHWIPKQHPDLLTRIVVSLNTRFSSLVELELRLSPEGRWESYLNTKKTSSQKLRERASVIAISPDDHSLIRGLPEERRNFLDDVFSDICPGYVEVLSRFEEVLHSRNKVLRNSQISMSDRELQTWTQMLIDSAAELTALRAEMWPEWRGQLLKNAPQVLGAWAPQFHIEFAQDLGGFSDLNAFRLAYKKALLESFDKDVATGWTHRGPHRDDFGIFLDGIDARQGASQGQARLLALHQKWSYAHWIQSEIGDEAILIVDDLSSELDETRRNGILSLVSALKTQILISTTDASLVDTRRFSEYTFFDVFEGQIRPQNHEKFTGVMNV